MGSLALKSRNVAQKPGWSGVIWCRCWIREIDMRNCAGPDTSEDLPFDASPGDSGSYIFQENSDFCRLSGDGNLSTVSEHLNSELRAYLEENDWLALVGWPSYDYPFADSGDSGGLVFARQQGCVILVGKHLGVSDLYPFHSYFLSLETFCFVAEDICLGDLGFPFRWE